MRQCTIDKDSLLCLQVEMLFSLEWNYQDWFSESKIHFQEENKGRCHVFLVLKLLCGCLLVFLYIARFRSKMLLRVQVLYQGIEPCTFKF